MCQDALWQGTNVDDDAVDAIDAVDAVDAVDVIVGEWHRERPDLDPRAKEVTGRVIRLASIFERSYGDAFEPFGISDNDYGLLAPLRRTGVPFELTPTELAKHRMITSGGMTAAIDRLERRGLVARVPNPTDRRGSLVRLTDEGRQAVDAAMTEHVQIEHRLAAALDHAEQEQLASLLRKLLLALEPRPARQR